MAPYYIINDNECSLQQLLDEKNSLLTHPGFKPMTFCPTWVVLLKCFTPWCASLHPDWSPLTSGDHWIPNMTPEVATGAKNLTVQLLKKLYVQLGATRTTNLFDLIKKKLCDNFNKQTKLRIVSHFLKLADFLEKKMSDCNYSDFDDECCSNTSCHINESIRQHQIRWPWFWDH